MDLSNHVFKTSHFASFHIILLILTYPLHKNKYFYHTDLTFLSLFLKECNCGWQFSWGGSVNR